MGVSKRQAVRNKHAIIAAATRLFRERAISLYSQMMGALVLSRAVISADRTLANEILSAARGDLLRAVGDETERVPVGRRQPQ